MSQKNFQKIVIALFLSISTLAWSQQPVHCSQKARFANAEGQAVSMMAAGTSQYDVHYYKLDLNLERNTTYISGNTSIGAKVKSLSMDTFVVELHANHTIDSLKINGQSMSFIRPGHITKVPLSVPLNQGSNFTAVIYYHGTPPSGGSAAIGQGFSTGSSPSWGNEVTWSLSQPYSAYEWFPVKQELQDKADSSEVWVTTSNDNKVGSNGVLKKITALPGSKVRYEWKSIYPIDYYLISVAVAKYVDYTIYAKPAGQNDSVKIVNYIYDNPGTLPNFKTEIDKTADMINVFSAKYGMYPFYKEKYGHCMAPFSGGMEHQTMTSQGFFFTDLTSHELAHQWFGDDVTCASWKDISMNEGFASYSEYVYLQVADPASGPNWLNNTHNSALQPFGSVYVDDTTDVSRIFSSSLTYDKGAFMLHMLRYEINNDSLFFNGLRAYRNQYSGTTVTGRQFKAAMEQFTGMNFTNFFDQWYYGQGYPMYDVRYNQGAGMVYLAIDQSASAPTITPLFKGHIDIKLTFSDRPDTTLRLFMDQNNKVFNIAGIEGSNMNVIVDPDQWVLNDLGTVIFDPSIGISDLKTGSAVSLFPNPSTGEFNLSFNSTIDRVHLTVYNLAGEKVYKDVIWGSNNYRFNLEEPAGTYIVTLLYVDGSEAEYKLIKE